MKRAAILAAIVAFASVPGVAQSLRNHNSNAPIDVDADRIEVQDRADRAVFSGNVNVRQAGLSLDAARITIAYDNSGSGLDIDRLDASGGVTVRSASETARGSVAIYDVNRRLITMVGGVTLQQGANQLRGGRLVIDLRSGRSVIDGGATGGTAVPGGTGGRVTGRFTVPQRDN